MTFQEKSLTCAECGAEYVFTIEEQELFHAKGYTNAPKRCPACREARKFAQEKRGFINNRFNNHGNNGRRQMYPVTCSQCGRETQVPFEPRSGRPVYCSECYNAIKAKNEVA